jgi:hypothetical protein
MINSLCRYASSATVFLEKGLAHPTFLGRAISWGIFYGALYLIVRKTVEICYPYFKRFAQYSWYIFKKVFKMNSALVPEQGSIQISRIERPNVAPLIIREESGIPSPPDQRTPILNPVIGEPNSRASSGVVAPGSRLEGQEEEAALEREEEETAGGMRTPLPSPVDPSKKK